MEEKAAGFISWIFHPLLMPTYALMLVFNNDNYFVLMLPLKLKLILTAIIFTNTLLLPLLFIWMMKRKGIIQSYHMPERADRTFPFLVTGLFYMATWFMINNLNLPGVYSMFLLGGTALIVISLIINLFWKISIHMAGVGGLTGGFIALNYLTVVDSPLLILVLVIISGLVGFARLKANTHNPSQVYVGFAAGAMVMAGITLLA